MKMLLLYVTTVLFAEVDPGIDTAPARQPTASFQVTIPRGTNVAIQTSSCSCIKVMLLLLAVSCP